MGNMKTAAAFAALAACIGGAAHLRRNIRMPVREYTRYALYMAALDDEICRNELEGKNIGGELILFPPKSESLQYRYHLFLQMNRRKSRAALQAEIAQMEARLEQSRLYAEQEKIDLEVSFVPAGEAAGDAAPVLS